MKTNWLKQRKTRTKMGKNQKESIGKSVQCKYKFYKRGNEKAKGTNNVLSVQTGTHTCFDQLAQRRPVEVETVLTVRIRIKSLFEPPLFWGGRQLLFMTMGLSLLSLRVLLSPRLTVNQNL